MTSSPVSYRLRRDHGQAPAPAVDQSAHPYTTVLSEALPHGALVGCALSREPVPAPDEVLDRLHPEERALAEGLRGYRQVDFAGGRLALRQALAALTDEALGPLLVDERGGPILPRSFVGSISHKRGLAVAMAARRRGWSLGVDLEDLAPARDGIAARILRPEEIEEVEALPEERRWTATVLRFSLKEAIYKALQPFVPRYIDFQEAAVHPDLAGTARVELFLSRGEDPPELDARYHWLPGRVLASVRARPRRARQGR